MCVICIKPKGVNMPPKHYIENMWYHNDDGAGFMYANGTNVVIDKGYMTIDDFERALKKLEKKVDIKNTALVMHFRIGTAGGNIPANTHPFPVSDTIPMLQKLDCVTKLGIVHNGVIPITPREKNISDTMEYIATTISALYRYDSQFYRSKDLLRMIEAQTHSKFAFLTPSGEIYTIGNFIEEAGILYSNSTYSYMTRYRSGLTRVYNYLPYIGEDELCTYPSSWQTELDMYTDKLMLLENGDYVIDYDTGNFFDSDDVTMFIDESGMIYVYDDFTQCACMTSNNATAFNREGLTLKFDPEKACEMIIDNQQLLDLEETAEPIETMSIQELTDEEKEKAAETDKGTDEHPF